MPPRLIINADDFGLSPGINGAIAELHEASCLTSATLMANGPSFVDAVAIARRCPSLGIGCHIVFVDGSPVSPVGNISTLLGGSSACFRRSLPHFAAALLSGYVREEEMLQEASAQIDRLQQTGVRVTHLDTHKHTHMLPAVARTLLQAAEQHGVPAIRRPFEPRWARGLGSATITRRAQLGVLNHCFEARFSTLLGLPGSSVATCDGSIGIAATGRLDRASLARLLAALPARGTWELVVHPGYRDAALDAQRTRLRASREIEMQALLQEIPKLSAMADSPELIHFGDLAALPPSNP